MKTEKRKGRHKLDKTLLGAYVSPEIKALAIMTASSLEISLTDLLLNGIKSEAARAGLYDSNGVVPEHKDGYEAIVDLVRQATAERKVQWKIKKTAP